MVSPAVHLKDEHVRGSREEVDEQHHGADRDVQVNSGQPAQLGRPGRIRRPRWRPSGTWGTMLSKAMLAMCFFPEVSPLGEVVVIRTCCSEPLAPASDILTICRLLHVSAEGYNRRRMDWGNLSPSEGNGLEGASPLKTACPLEHLSQGPSLNDALFLEWHTRKRAAHVVFGPASMS